MSFAAAVERLSALGLELAPGAPRRKFELAHMRTLAAALGDPQTKFPSVLIAGTNGKGSTAATLASILAAADYRTGLYTSPHLERVTERIRVADRTTPDPGAPRLDSETWDIAPQIPDAVIPSEARSAESRDPRICLSPFTEIPEPDFARLYFQVDETGRRLVADGRRLVADGRLPHAPSYFETLTALAFLYFAERNLDIAVLEVGLGGRLDATNIVDPLLSIITDIALDHQEYLGPTIATIAREKAGILRRGGTLITLPQHPEANHAIGEVAMELGVRGINAAPYLPGRDFAHASGGPFIERSEMSGGVAAPQLRAPSIPQSHRGMGGIGPQSFKPAPGNYQPSTINHQLPPNHYNLSLSGQTLHIHSPLPGEHQQRNIALAIAAAIELRNQSGDNIRSDGGIRNLTSYNIPNSAIESGVSHTSWPGRLEFLPPNLLLDVAHNPAGAWALRAAIASLPESQPRTLLFSCLRDKDLREMAQILFPLFDSTGWPIHPADISRDEWGTSRAQHHIVLAPVDSPRAASLDELLAAARALDAPAHPAPNTHDALALARQLTPPGGLIVATGSIYLVGALRTLATR